MTKTAAQGTAAEKAAPAKKTVAKNAATQKTAAKNAATQKTAAKKTAAKKTAAKKTTAEPRAMVEESPAKQAIAKTSTSAKVLLASLSEQQPLPTAAASKRRTAARIPLPAAIPARGGDRMATAVDVATAARAAVRRALLVTDRQAPLRAAVGDAGPGRATSAKHSASGSGRPSGPTAQESPDHAEAVDLLTRVYELALGSAVLAGGSGGRIIGGAAGVHGPGSALPAEPVIDFGVGLSDAALEVLQRAIARAAAATSPLVALAGRPAKGVVAALVRWTAPVVVPIQERGRQRRAEAEVEAAATAEAMLPIAVDLILERVDIAAVLAKIDLLEVLAAVLEQVDVAEVLDLVDVDEVLAATMERVDITDFALQYIDMRRVLDAAAKEVDMTAVLRTQLEGMDLADIIRSTPTNIAGGALRQTSRLMRRG